MIYKILEKMKIDERFLTLCKFITQPYNQTMHGMFYDNIMKTTESFSNTSVQEYFYMLQKHSRYS